MSQASLVKLLMAVVISLGLLGSGLYVLLTFNWAENPQMIAAATGWIGLVVGVWVR
mgnify:CR=1 FL=1